jgi:hypothetical protein
MEGLQVCQVLDIEAGLWTSTGPRIAHSSAGDGPLTLLSASGLAGGLAECQNHGAETIPGTHYHPL